MQHRSLLVFMALISALIHSIGCSAGSITPGTGGGGDGQGADNAGGTGAGFGQGGGSNGQEIQIEPASFELVIDNGNIPTQALTATLGGIDVTDEVTWTFEKPFIGDVVGSTFTPTGVNGGVGTITATIGSSSGTATASVVIIKTVDVGGVTPEQKDQLDNPTGGADPSMQVLYPYDQTVFPLDVLAPEIQWNGGGAADAYKLTVDEANYQYTAYFTAAPPSRFLVAEADWAAIGTSGGGAQSDPVTVSLTRWSGGQAYSPVTRTWRIAQGRLKGAVYYWELPGVCNTGNYNGRILKIKPSSPVAEEFYQPNGCWGCHTVSRDGSRMMATLDTTVPFPQFTLDLTTDPATPSTITPGAGLGGTFSAYNATGDRILVSNDGGAVDQLRIVDSTTGQVLNPNALGDNCAEPAWSPDGTKLSAICGINSNGWAFDSNTGNLMLADVAADGTTVSNISTLVPQAAGAGRPAYPSFTPGSEYIAYGRTTYGSRSVGDGTIWLTDLSGSQNKLLANISGDNRSFNPVFAPLRAGGYYWLVFISRRDYGNRIVGANRQQLWIAAISDPPSQADPSQPPFYLRGQEDCGLSENAYFALEPCKELGQGCQSGVDCCSGTCIKDPETNTYVCGIPGECAEDGNACATAADCCDYPESECVDGFCQKPPPQ
ncbi:MAG: hypothetical protein IPM79_23425 [Polyangiaceae bacterium]|jgi:Tol biopolymer transport system component|nr:hypothetical protein [Polyangiaceae bacterium]MBK8940482.1 hypothetical protein [Polyangiaceae bacterium]